MRPAARLVVERPHDERRFSLGIVRAKVWPRWAETSNGVLQEVLARGRSYCLVIVPSVGNRVWELLWLLPLPDRLPVWGPQESADYCFYQVLPRPLAREPLVRSEVPRKCHLAVMQPNEIDDLLFCDICTVSVPLLDLTRGAAVRFQGKTIGACCVAALQQSLPPLSASHAYVANEPARPSRMASESRQLSLVLALLTAIAAATIFVDSRLANLEARYGPEIEVLRGSIKSQADVLQKVSMDLDGAARRADLDEFGERIKNLDSSQQKASTQLVGTAADQSQQLRALFVRMNEFGSRPFPDHGKAIAELHAEVQQLAMNVADAKAQPRVTLPVGAELNGAAKDKPIDALAIAPELAGLSAADADQVLKLKEADAAERFKAVDLLLRSKNKTVVQLLLPMAKDPDTFVRRLTVEGIKEYRLAIVVDALLLALADPEEIVRDTAWRSLKEVTGQKLPFDPRATRDARSKAQRAWQEWWEQHKAEFGA